MTLLTCNARCKVCGGPVCDDPSIVHSVNLDVCGPCVIKGLEERGVIDKRGNLTGGRSRRTRRTGVTGGVTGRDRSK